MTQLVQVDVELESDELTDETRFYRGERFRVAGETGDGNICLFDENGKIFIPKDQFGVSDVGLSTQSRIVGTNEVFLGDDSLLYHLPCDPKHNDDNEQMVTTPEGLPLAKLVLHDIEELIQKFRTKKNSCCDKENRGFNGGCSNCGDPSF